MVVSKGTIQSCDRFAVALALLYNVDFVPKGRCLATIRFDEHRIDVAVRRAESKFSVGLDVELPKVPYRESITRPAEAMRAD